MARDDDSDDKGTAPKASKKPDDGKSGAAAKPKENGGAKPAEAKKADKAEKSGDKSAAKAAADKPADRAEKPADKADKPADRAEKPADKADKPAEKSSKKAKEGKEGREAKAKPVADKSATARVAAKPAAHAAAHAHGHHAPDRKEYWKIFVVLFVLTVIEVAVAQVPGIGKGLMVSALVGLALAKAACVALFYMHLKHETKVLRMYVALPFAAPAVYALVLIAEAAWRLTR